MTWAGPRLTTCPIRVRFSSLQTFVIDHYYRHYELYQYILVNPLRVILQQEEANCVEVVGNGNGKKKMRGLAMAEESDVIVTFPEPVLEEEEGEGGDGEAEEEEGEEGI